jgi:DNA modification methylase
MNFQSCHNVAFVGLSDSYEAFYQAVRRCWRFGQQYPVDCHVICAETEGAVVRNIERKEKHAEEMAEGMIKHMAHINRENIQGMARETVEYERTVKRGNRWEAHLGDAVEICREQADESVDFIIYSPPFASLYTYSNSERDIGNVRDYEEFAEHYNFLVPELYRMLKPGRLLSFHCMNLPMSKQNDGVIGIRDFRGDLIRMHQSSGFIFHSEVCIWKDPVTAMQRTKAIGLLYKQLRKDSAMSRQGIPDYLVTMRKPGENLEPVTKTHEGFPVSLWQRYASPVWMDIDASDTLQRESAREEKDERHIAPLQLGVIRRAIELWTNPGDLVFSPFGGIGSEGYVAIQLDRRASIVELKRSYWEQAWKNLQSAEMTGTQNMLLEVDESA